MEKMLILTDFHFPKIKLITFATVAKHFYSTKEYSFSGDLSLETINIPKTISILSSKAFINTPSLTSIMKESNNTYYVMNNNEVYYRKKVLDQSLIFVPRNLKQISIIQSCSTIESGAFCGPNIENIYLPDISLVSIEDCAFAHSTKLKKIIIPESVKSIGNEAFIDCQNLEIVEFQSNCQLKEIPKFCFAFSGLKSINLPRSIQIINDSSFYFCHKLMNVNLDHTNVKYIGDSAFSGTCIEELVFPSSIRYIENHAFENTKSLKLIDFTHCKSVKDWNKLKDMESIHKFNQKNKRIKTFTKISKSKLSEQSFSPPIIKKSASKTNLPLIIKPNQLKSTLDIIENKNMSSPKEEDKRQISSSSTLKQIKYNNLLNQNKIHYCYVNESAFYNSSVKIFKFNLESYKWYDFFDKCSHIMEYIVNTNIHLFLKKLTKENTNNCSLGKRTYWPYRRINTVFIDRLVGDFYKVNNIIWKNEDLILFEREKSFRKTVKLSIFNFLNTNKLSKVFLSNDINIKKIPKLAFSCSRVKEVTIPSSVIEIGMSAFKLCSKLEKITFLSNSQLKTIGKHSFYECKELKTIDIPKNVKIIPFKCFFNCRKLSKINLNDGLTEISCYSFANNFSLKEINIPDSVSVIYSYAFSNCINLKKVNTTQNTNIVKLHKGSFENTQIEELKLNYNLKKLFKPRNLPKLNKISFYNGKLSNTFQISEDGIIYKYKSEYNKKNELINLRLQSISNLLPDNSKIEIKFDECYLLFAPKNLKCLKIRGLFLGKYVLDDMKNLTTIEYSKDSNNYIDDFKMNSKKNCNVNEIKILGNYALMEDYCLSYFDSLEIVEFGESTNLFYISKGAFKGCKNLKKIIIPDTCVIIKEGAFKDCTGLKSVEFRKKKGKSSKDLYLKIIEKEAFFNCKSLSTFHVPPTIEQIHDKVFMSCNNLEIFEFGSNSLCMKSIGECAFKNCSSLKSFNIPESCVSVGKSAFMNCTNLEIISVKGTCFSNIQYRTFYNCSSLKRFNTQVSSNYDNFFVGYQSFMNCISLKEFIIDLINSKEEGRENDESIRRSCMKKEIHSKAFCNCKSLEKIHIFIDNLQIINIDAFDDCDSLQTIEINSNNSMPLFVKKMSNLSFISEKIIVKIYNEGKENRSIKLKEIINPKITRKRCYKEHFSHLNTSFLSDEKRNEDDNDETIDQKKKTRKRFITDDMICLYTQKKEIFENYRLYSFPSLNNKGISIGIRYGKSIFDI